MGIDANTLAQGSIRAATGLGQSWPVPFTMYGYIGANSATVGRGDALVVTAPVTGGYEEATNDPTAATWVGFCSSVSPRRQDHVPLTAGFTPVAASPDHMTSPAAGAPDFGNPDDPDFGIQFWPAMMGNTFAGHLINEADDGGDEGTDIRADALSHLHITVGLTSTELTTGAVVDQQVVYPSREGVHVFAFAGGMANTDLLRIEMFQNPQPTRAVANVLLNEPGPVVQTPGGGGANDTFNPVVIAIPVNSVYV